MRKANIKGKIFRKEAIMRKPQMISRILGIVVVAAVVGAMLGPVYAGDRATQDVSQVCADNVTCTEISKVDTPPVFDRTKTVTITSTEDGGESKGAGSKTAVVAPAEDGGESKGGGTKTVVIAPYEDVTESEKPGTPSSPDNAWIYDLQMQNAVDDDYDGYYESFSLCTDADTDVASLDVYEDIYASSGEDWSTSCWTIYGAQFDWACVPFDMSEFAISAPTVVTFWVYLYDCYTGQYYDYMYIDVPVDYDVDAWIYDLQIQDAMDEDYDGYYESFSLCTDADTNVASLNVYEDIYASSGDYWSTGCWEISYSAVDWACVGFSACEFDIPPATPTVVTLCVDLYNCYTGEYYDTACIDVPIDSCADAWIYDLQIQDAVDEDYDGYYESFSLCTDADTNVASLDVYGEIVASTGDYWPTSCWTISYDAVDWACVGFSACEFSISHPTVVTLCVDLYHCYTQEYYYTACIDVPIDRCEDAWIYALQIQDPVDDDYDGYYESFSLCTDADTNVASLAVYEEIWASTGEDWPTTCWTISYSVVDWACVPFDMTDFNISVPTWVTLTVHLHNCDTGEYYDTDSIDVPIDHGEPDIDVNPSQLNFECATDTLSSDETPPSSDEIEMILLDSPPTPPVDMSQTIVTEDAMPQSAVILSNVPTSEWTYGCTATSAGMLFGYYDRTGYPNMYTGPTNGGVCPLTDLGQGIPGNPRYPIPGSCYIIATENGLDGISSNAHVDDYWISDGSAGPDPWEGNWPEHPWELCTADFLGTNQWKWDYSSFPATDGVIDANVDGATYLWTNNDGSKLYDWCPGPAYGTPTTSCCHGMRLFAESRGYTVETNYNQLTDNQHSSGFTLAEFQAEIDAGRPVLIQLIGHTIVGIGYSATTDTVFIHDTWDNDMHGMTWGGSYAGMDLYAVTVIHLAPPGDNCQTITVSNDGDADLVVPDIEIGYQPGEPTGWLDANPKSFTVGPVGSQVVNVCVDCAGLSCGEYHGWLDIRSNDPDEDPYHVTVTLAVVCEPELCYSPASHDFGVKCAGETDSTTFEIWNCGAGTLSYSCSEGCNWVNVHPVSGSSTGESDTITVDIDTADLSEGSYACDISISSNGGGATFTVTVDVMQCDNWVYLDPQDSRTTFCNTVDVDVWVDATGFQGGQIELLYDSTCCDVENWERNETLFPLGTWESDTPGEEWITFTGTSPLSGIYLIGTLTIHGLCCEEMEDCSTILDFVDPSKLFDQFGSEIPATWVDGTFTCTTGICGDVAPYPDCDGIVNMGDVILLLNYVGHPGEYQLCCEWCGDVAPCPASDDVINMGDVVLLLNYVGHPGEYDLCCE